MNLLVELRHAWARLRHARVYTLSCVLILAAGIGLSLYMFGAINGFMLKPLPFPDGDRLVHVELTQSRDPSQTGEPSLHDYLDLRRMQTVLTGLHAYGEGTINLSDGVRPERFDGAFVSGEMFSALGLKPQLGRSFTLADERVGAEAVVLIGHDVWQTRYGGAADVVGQSVRVNGRDATIIGVMPQGVRFPRMHQVWLPLDMDLSQVARGQSRGVEVFGFLGPDQTLASARDAFGRMVADIARSHPDVTRGDLAVVKPFAEEFISPITRTILWTLFAAVVLVLLIACANVANLMLVRGSFKARELALRSAIGAGRGRLAFGVLAEAVLIALMAVPIGWLGARWGGELTMASIRAGEDPPVYWTQFSIDGWAYVFILGVTVLSTLAAGLYPALRAAGAANAPTLRDGGHGSTHRRSGKLSRTLVLVEIALCTALLTAAGLTMRSVWEVQAMPAGVRLDGILTGRLGMFPESYPDPADRIAFVERLRQQLRETAGVQQAAVASAVPLQGVASAEVLIEGATLPPPGERGPFHFASVVTPGYFDVFDVPVLAGRDFDARDRADSLPVAIVSQSLAQRLWPQREPLGQRFQPNPRSEDAPWLTVIGVVGDVKMGMEGFGLNRNDRGEQFYRPYAQQPLNFVSPVIRVAGDQPLAFADALRAAVTATDPDIPVYWLRSMQDWLAIVAFDLRLMAKLFGTFALFALVLACAGLYAVLAYTVATRTREIGVRRALGASRGNILGLIARQSAIQVAIGLAVGGLLGVGFGKALAMVLYRVGSFDPQTFLTVCAVLGSAAVMATWLPARRALAVEPNRALHDG